NASSGSGEAQAQAERIRELFATAGRAAEITLAEGARLVETAKAAVRARAPAIVAGGGDGTINTVASIVVGTGIPLGLLPLGTLNHFAKDLGIPLTIDEAVGVVLGGRTIEVDVGEVNGKIFLNNSSLGLYPRIVRLRERSEARGIWKWPVAAWATLRVLR